MAEININAKEIDNGVAQLRTLQAKIESFSVPPVTIGGGKVVNELEEIVGILQTINTDLVSLTTNTILFLQNVRDDFVETDIDAAKKMSEK